MKKIIIALFILTPLMANARKIKHLRVIWQEDPAHESYIAWTTKGLIPTRKGRIYYDTTSHKGNIKQYKFVAKPFVQKPYSYSFSFLHGAKLKNLTPNTKYYFVVKEGRHVTREFYFITAPTKGTEFELFFGGDSRSDRAKRQSMNRLMKQMFQDNPHIYALVHGGDYVANGFSWKQWKKWLDDLQLTVADDGRILPIIPTRGNHEISRLLYDDIWLKPGKIFRDNYFTTRIGDLSLINLDSNVIISGPQKKWLKNELKKAAENQRWIVTNYHRPVYPAVKKPGRAKKHWVPLFEKYLVDMAFESDGHTLKRTAPIYGEQINFEKGITYVGEGGLGVKLRQPTRADEWYLQSPGYALAAYHLLKLKVSSSQMVYTVHLDDGKIFDRMVLSPRNRSKSISSEPVALAK